MAPTDTAASVGGEAAWLLARQSLSKAILHASQSSRSLPEQDDFHFYANFLEFRAAVASLRVRLRALLQNFGVQDFPEDVDDSFDWASQTLDMLLEQVDASLDESSRPGPGALGGNTARTDTGQQGGALQQLTPTLGVPVTKHAALIAKPQKAFEDPPDNANDFDSPGGLPPAELDGEDARVAKMETMQYAKRQLEAHLPRAPMLLEETPFELVETVEKLQAMADQLDAGSCREVAIDLENHSYRSFQGFVCLMQVSTRSHDFVVDALALRSHIGRILGPIFGDPSWVKVLHGADHDILWLQRDFGITVKNMFDTGQAARVLGLPRFGLGHLLAHYCDVRADKRYQLADWRVRPLPGDMIKYAREDTHYLLYCYDKLMEELLGAVASDEPSAPYLEVVVRSRALCLRQYRKSRFTDSDYLSFYRSQGKQLGQLQLAVLSEVYRWRDETARREDESIPYVLPNHLLLRIAEEMPSSVRKFGAILRGAAPVAGRSAAILVDVIARAKESIQIPLAHASAISAAGALQPVTAGTPQEGAQGQAPCYQSGEVKGGTGDLEASQPQSGKNGGKTSIGGSRAGPRGMSAMECGPGPGSSPSPSFEANAAAEQPVVSMESRGAPQADVPETATEIAFPLTATAAAKVMPRRAAGQLAQPGKRPRLGLGAMLAPAGGSSAAVKEAGAKALEVACKLQASLLLPFGQRTSQQQQEVRGGQFQVDASATSGTAHGDKESAPAQFERDQSAVVTTAEIEAGHAVGADSKAMNSERSFASTPSCIAREDVRGVEGGSRAPASLRGMPSPSTSQSAARRGGMPQSLRERHRAGGGSARDSRDITTENDVGLAPGASLRASPPTPAACIPSELVDVSGGVLPGQCTGPEPCPPEQGRLEQTVPVECSRLPGDSLALLPAYDYEAARAALKLTAGGSTRPLSGPLDRRGSAVKNMKGTRGKPKSGAGGGQGQQSEKWIFDPLDDGASGKDGIKPGKRSQIYPRSGNRSVTFRE